MPLADILFGRPLATSEEKKEKIGSPEGIATFGLDALASAAYGPEAALTLLIPMGAAALSVIQPLSLAIILLLAVVYFSYRQTIAAYPAGGGSYTVAKENLGTTLGLLSAAALMMDYLLNVAVAISAGVGALVSAAPALQPHTLALCLAVLALLTIVNLRGTRESGVLFLIPSYLFVACLFGVIGWGILHPKPAVAPPGLPRGEQAITWWLLLKAFASGCTAMTGVEAVSNGVQSFREPVVRTARKTLTLIIAILIVLLAGIAYLSHTYQVGATPPGQPGYQSVLSQITAAVVGKQFLYSVTIASILMVLCLSANTSFAGFPRLCRAVALDGYLPKSFASRGRRLVYSEGIWVLAILAAALLVLFGGITNRLIPLFAVGAFLAFTLSQAGMVAHWKRTGGRGARRSMLINGVGALATGATAAVVLAAKFSEGAWVVAVLIPAVLAAMTAVRRHYCWATLETAAKKRFVPERPPPAVVIVPVEEWNTVSEKELRFALGMSEEVQVVHVVAEGEEPQRPDWAGEVERVAKLILLPSPYRFVLQPIMNHVFSVELARRDRMVAVVIPVLVARRWYHNFLHNQRGKLLAAILLLKGNRRIAIVNVPWYLTD